MENTVTKEYAGLFSAIEEAIGELEKIRSELIIAEQKAEDEYVARLEDSKS